jgi:hypothetical protein
MVGGCSFSKSPGFCDIDCLREWLLRMHWFSREEDGRKTFKAHARKMSVTQETFCLSVTLAHSDRFRHSSQVRDTSHEIPITCKTLCPSGFDCTLRHGLRHALRHALFIPIKRLLAHFFLILSSFLSKPNTKASLFPWRLLPQRLKI